MRRHVDLVAGALRTAEIDVRVSGLIVLTGEVKADLERAEVGGTTVVGLSSLAAELEARPRLLERSSVERAAAALLLAFASPDEEASVEELIEARVPVSSKSIRGLSFDRLIHTWYLRPWTRGSSARLYLKRSDGGDLAWKDLRSGNITMLCDDESVPLVSAVLRGASGRGVALDSAAVPRVPVELLGSKRVGRWSQTYWGVLLGQEWTSRLAHRLYGRLIDPVEGHFELGYVDLTSNAVMPASTAKLSRNLGAPDRYLERLLGSWHPEEWAKSR